MGKRTFAIIKPDAVRAGKTGSILKIIEEAGFQLVSLKRKQLTHKDAELFYAVHKEQPFYGDLCQYMSSGPVVAMILEKTNAVADFRELIGATNPAKAKAGTIRALFGVSVEANAIHGSDSDENAYLEGGFFFSRLEQFTC